MYVLSTGAGLVGGAYVLKAHTTSLGKNRTKIATHVPTLDRAKEYATKFRSYLFCIRYIKYRKIICGLSV